MDGEPPKKKNRKSKEEDESVPKEVKRFVKKANSVNKLVEVSWSQTQHEFKIRKPTSRRDSAAAHAKQNVDLPPAPDPNHLPKVKSTINSHPKFISKSRLMLGVNKFIGGTYRNTTLAQQQLN